MRETDDSITIKYPHGAAKIMKILLPPEVLAKYPVVQEVPAVVPPLLPPEPKGLEKPSKGERSITARDAISGSEVRWVCRLAENGRGGGITRSSKNRAGEFKTDFIFSFEAGDVEQLKDAIDKAMKWTAAVTEKKPPVFDKSMGTVLGREWTFSWDKGRVLVHTGVIEAPNFEEQDLENIRLLLQALPYMVKERRDETKAAEDFAATLK